MVLTNDDLDEIISGFAEKLKEQGGDLRDSVKAAFKSVVDEANDTGKKPVLKLGFGMSIEVLKTEGFSCDAKLSVSTKHQTEGGFKLQPKTATAE